MKLKVILTLPLLAGSALSQLTPIKEESGFMSLYDNEPPFTLTGQRATISFHANSSLRSSLSFRENVIATTAFDETPRFAASSHGFALHRFATRSAARTESTAFSNAVDPDLMNAASNPQADAFPITSHDEEVSALIAASTIP